MTTEDEIGTIRAALAKHGNIWLAIVFGSAAQGFARTESDLDIAVGARRPLDWRERSQLIGELTKAGGRAVDLIDLATVGEPPLGQILSKGRRILGSDADHGKLLARHLFDQADFLPYRNRSLEERRRRWIGH